MNTRLTFTEFVGYVRENIQKGWWEDRDLEIRKILKNNGVELTALLLTCEDAQISPTLYLEEFYEGYRESGRDDPDFWVGRIRKGFEEAEEKMGMVPIPEFGSFESMRDRIVFRLIHYDRNRKFLDGCPHIRLHDLAITFRCMVSLNEDAVSSAAVTEDQMNYWGIGVKDLMEAAGQNTPRLLPGTIIPMGDYMMENSGFRPEGQEMLYIATNRQMVYGAAVILYEGFLDGFARDLGMDFYLLPSSVHEFLFVPDRGEFPEEELISMVGEVNEAVVSPEEVLSDSVYHFSREEGRLTCCGCSAPADTYLVP